MPTTIGFQSSHARITVGQRCSVTLGSDSRSNNIKTARKRIVRITSICSDARLDASPTVPTRPPFARTKYSGPDPLASPPAKHPSRLTASSRHRATRAISQHRRPESNVSARSSLATAGSSPEIAPRTALSQTAVDVPVCRRTRGSSCSCECDANTVVRCESNDRIPPNPISIIAVGPSMTRIPVFDKGTFFARLVIEFEAITQVDLSEILSASG